MDVWTVFRIVVANQIPWRCTARRRLAQLLTNPCIRRQPGHPNMDDAPRTKLGDEEREERTEAEIRELQEITGPDDIGMVAEKGCPSLTVGIRWGTLPYVAPNRPLGHLDAQFQQLALYPLHPLHKRLLRAISLINVIVSAGIRGVRDPGCDFRMENRRKP